MKFINEEDENKGVPVRTRWDAETLALRDELRALSKQLTWLEYDPDMEGAESIKRRFKADKKKILAEQERRLNIKPELPGVESEPAFDFKINDPTSTSDDTTEQSGIFSRMDIRQ